MIIGSLLTACGQTISASETEILSTDSIQPEASATTVKESSENTSSEWFQAYMDYMIANHQYESEYTFIYLDNDDIPEMLFDEGEKAENHTLLYFKDGEVSKEIFDGEIFKFLDRTGLIYTKIGKSYDYNHLIRVYSFEKGNISLLASAREYMTDEDIEKYRSGDYYKEDFLTYEFDGKAVDKETYDNKVGELIDIERIHYPINKCSYSELIHIRNSFNDHKNLTADDILKKALDSSYETLAVKPTMRQHYDNWQEAYSDYIECWIWEDCEETWEFWHRAVTAHEIEWSKHHGSFYLIFLDNDDVPELFLSTNSFAGGSEVATFQNGKCTGIHLRDSSSRYVPYSGCLFTDAKGAVYITKLEKGNFDIKLVGDYLMYWPIEGDSETVEFEYSLGKDSKSVTKEEYEKEISKYMDLDAAVWPEGEYQYEEIKSILDTGSHRSEGHSYRFVLDNVSWNEALEQSIEKGGYLAVITCNEELEYVKHCIEKSELTDYSFYVAYRKDSVKVDGEFILGRWVYPDGRLERVDILYDYSGYEDPSFPGYTDREFEKNEWELMYADFGLLKYNKDNSGLYLYYAPEDIVSIAPKYDGKIGYIVEYDE